jgi:hypothetical protein
MAEKEERSVGAITNDTTLVFTAEKPEHQAQERRLLLEPQNHAPGQHISRGRQESQVRAIKGHLSPGWPGL